MIIVLIKDNSDLNINNLRRKNKNLTAIQFWKQLNKAEDWFPRLASTETPYNEPLTLAQERYGVIYADVIGTGPWKGMNNVGGEGT